MTMHMSAAETLTLWNDREFLDWLVPGVHADLIDGEKFMHSPVNFKHARLLNFLDRLMGSYIESHELGELHREVVAVRLSSRNVFLPDLSYFTPEQVALLEPSHAPFAPTLVVEALSPRTADRDVGPSSPPTRNTACRNTGFSIRRPSPTASTAARANCWLSSAPVRKSSTAPASRAFSSAANGSIPSHSP